MKLKKVKMVWLSRDFSVCFVTKWKKVPRYIVELTEEEYINLKKEKNKDDAKRSIDVGD